jgi:Ca2+/Na+ antiporter
MNDVEHDLRELFDRKASSVGSVAPKLPVAVRKRSRSRELGTVLVGGFTILALVVGSVAVLRAVDTGRRSDRIATDDPWAGCAWVVRRD